MQLLDRVKKFFSPKLDVIEERIYNPLNVKIGRPITIDALDFRNLTTYITSINEYKSDLGDFVDYQIEDINPSGTKVVGKIRFIKGGRSLILEQYDQLDFDEGLWDALQKPDHSMNVDDDDIALHEVYWRPKASRRAGYEVTVTSLKDADDDGIVVQSEVEVNAVKMWDFDKEKSSVLERPQWLYVELNNRTRVFTLYRGFEIAPSQIQY